MGRQYIIKDIINYVGGQERLRHLVEKEGYTYSELREVLGIPGACNTTIKKILNSCNIEIPYPQTKRETRLWLIRWDCLDDEKRYWEDRYLVKVLHTKLKSPVLNTAGDSKRYVVSARNHPRASSANQVKAHIILWEIKNKQYLPDGMELEPIDGNFTNLKLSNFKLRKIRDRLSSTISGEKNPGYIDGTSTKSLRYSRGWVKISTNLKKDIGICESCGEEDSTLTCHHIINYRLFDEEDNRVHCKENLLVLCNSCHGKVHLHALDIRPHISETRYEKLLELLESLKSQVPESKVEILLDVEKQLGLTDNQQPSP